MRQIHPAQRYGSRPTVSPPRPLPKRVLVEELDAEREVRPRHLDRRRQVEDGQAPDGEQRARLPEREQLLQEGQPGSEGGQADDDVAADAEALERIDRLLVREAMPGTEADRRVQEDEGAGHDDASLEAAARSLETERDQPQADDQRETDHQDADHPQAVALDSVDGAVELPLLGFLPSVAAEKQDGSEHGREQDELLAHRVDSAHVEDDRVDHVRRMPERHDDVVEQQTVRAVEVAEAVNAGERPDEEGAHDSEHGQGDQPADALAAHVRSRRRAGRHRAGEGPAIVDTTSIDSATSGAWSTKKTM